MGGLVLLKEKNETVYKKLSSKKCLESQSDERGDDGERSNSDGSARSGRGFSRGRGSSGSSGAVASGGNSNTTEEEGGRINVASSACTQTLDGNWLAL